MKTAPRPAFIPAESKIVLHGRLCPIHILKVLGEGAKLLKRGSGGQIRKEISPRLRWTTGNFNNKPPFAFRHVVCEKPSLNCEPRHHDFYVRAQRDPPSGLVCQMLKPIRSIRASWTVSRWKFRLRLVQERPTAGEIAEFRKVGSVFAFQHGEKFTFCPQVRIQKQRWQSVQPVFEWGQ